MAENLVRSPTLRIVAFDIDCSAFGAPCSLGLFHVWLPWPLYNPEQPFTLLTKSTVGKIRRKNIAVALMLSFFKVHRSCSRLSILSFDLFFGKQLSKLYYLACLSLPT